MTAVAHPVDIAPAVMATATGAHLVVDTTMMTAHATVRLQDVAQPMTILLPVDDLMIPTAAITPLTRT